jgi:hypothetical protein
VIRCLGTGVLNWGGGYWRQLHMGPSFWDFAKEWDFFKPKPKAQPASEKHQVGG